MRVDLHIHTNFSDGTYTIQQVLEIAEKLRKSLGLGVIAITDHDDVRALHCDLSAYKGIIVPGVELSFARGGYLYDVLGYGIDAKKMDKFLNRLTHDDKVAAQTRIMRDFMTVCEKNGWKYNKELKCSTARSHEAFNLVFSDIISYEENASTFTFPRPSFFKEHFSNPQSPFYVNQTRHLPSLDECVKAIHGAGGIAILAHSGAYGMEEPQMREFIEFGIKSGIDGVEKWYTTHTAAHMKIIDEYVKKNGLIVSGGSDFHGEAKPGYSIGEGKGNLVICAEDMPWINNLQNKIVDMKSRKCYNNRAL